AFQACGSASSESYGRSAYPIHSCNRSRWSRRTRPSRRSDRSTDGMALRIFSAAQSAVQLSRCPSCTWPSRWKPSAEKSPSDLTLSCSSQSRRQTLRAFPHRPLIAGWPARTSIRPFPWSLLMPRAPDHSQQCESSRDRRRRLSAQLAPDPSPYSRQASAQDYRRKSLAVPVQRAILCPSICRKCWQRLHRNSASRGSTGSRSNSPKPAASYHRPPQHPAAHRKRHSQRMVLWPGKSLSRSKSVQELPFHLTQSHVSTAARRRENLRLPPPNLAAQCSTD